ncbi:MAG: undecaprenyl-diphosphate phosphatase [Burkholderiales bacterium]
MSLLKLLLLALAQGICELLPVSSSAHVILAEKLLGLDPTAPAMTLLLVMLHTGTMFAVIVYFWRSWRSTYFSSSAEFRRNGWRVAVATIATGMVGLTLLEVIKHVIVTNRSSFEVEQLFGNPQLMAASLATAGLLILWSSRRGMRAGGELSSSKALCIGAVQGLCLPFRGLSRSGATISTGLALGVARRRAEEFSFALALALALVLTPAVVAKEALRFYKAPVLANGLEWWPMLLSSVLGMALSFGAGLLALRWLSRWLEQDRWHLFGFYCLVMAMVVYRVG